MKMLIKYAAIMQKTKITTPKTTFPEKIAPIVENPNNALIAPNPQMNSNMNNIIPEILKRVSPNDSIPIKVNKTPTNPTIKPKIVKMAFGLRFLNCIFSVSPNNLVNMLNSPCLAVIS